MAFGDYLSAAVNAAVQAGVKGAGVMPLGKFIEALETLDQGKTIVYDFCGFSPTEPDSYRGFYDHLAFGFVDLPYPEDVKVGEVLEMAKNAVGETYHGYKGGEYVMGEDTPLWVAEWGKSSGTAITGIEDAYVIVIKTAFVEF